LSLPALSLSPLASRPAGVLAVAVLRHTGVTTCVPLLAVSQGSLLGRMNYEV